jgi:hypothetical protein
MCPSNGSVSRPSLHRVRSGAFPCFIGTTENSDSRYPFRQAPFSSPDRTTPVPVASLPSPAGTPARSLGGCCPVPPLTGSLFQVEGIGPPRFLGNPKVCMPCSSTPARWAMPGLYGMSMQPSAVLNASAPAMRPFRGSITRPTHTLSTLRSVGCPHTTQDSLPAGGQPLPGGIDYPLGPSALFRDRFPCHLSQVPRLLLAHQDSTHCRSVLGTDSRWKGRFSFINPEASGSWHHRAAGSERPHTLPCNHSSSGS